MSKKMIPLHIADQAVAACEAEIQKLREENAALKAEVERSNNLARIREKELSRIQIENDLLKAEVERLKLDYYENKTGEVSATIVQTFNTETGEADYVVSLDDYKKMADMFNAEFLRLKAEVERLTDAGDSMAAVIIQYRCSPWGQKVPNAFTVWQAWHAAKEGKPQP